MSDNKKYYYIKIKDNYFDQDNIKILEAQENGYIYSLIIIKLYSKSAKFEGQLKMTRDIPYDPANIEVLARVLNHDVAHVKEALRLGVTYDLITIKEGSEIWMTEMQNLIGHASTESERKQVYRNNLKKKKLLEDKGQCPGQRTPEKEKEKEKEKEIYIEREKEPEISLSNINSYEDQNRIEDISDKLFVYWNKKDNLPKFKGTSFNINPDSLMKIRNHIKDFTLSECKDSIDLYSKIKEDPNCELFPVYATVKGFLSSGVEKYYPGALPFDRCKKKNAPKTEKEVDDERRARIEKELSQ